MNISAGFRAAGQGLKLIAEHAGRREERNWAMLREEHMAELRQKQTLQLEDRRSDNNEKAAEAQRGFIGEENDKNRKADDARADRSDRRADAREKRADAKADTRELSELRRHRVSTLQNFRTQYGKALSDLNTAKASGMIDEADLAEMRANVQYIAQEMQDFDAQSKDALAAAGDRWAKSQLQTDEDFAQLGGGRPSVVSQPPETVSSLAKPKPLQSTSVASGRTAAPPSRFGGGRGMRPEEQASVLDEDIAELEAELARPPITTTNSRAGFQAEKIREAKTKERDDLIRRKALLLQPPATKMVPPISRGRGGSWAPESNEAPVARLIP